MIESSLFGNTEQRGDCLTSRGSLAVWIVALLPMAWFEPTHRLPWLAAWADAAALTLLLLAATAVQTAGIISRPWLAFLGLAASMIAAQQCAGLIAFRGDALVALVYLTAFALAMTVGSSLALSHRRSLAAPVVVAGAVWMSALGCAGLAVLHWLRVPMDSIWVVTADAARAGGNLAQPNQLATVLFIGGVAACRLAELRALPAWLASLSLAVLIAGGALTGSRTLYLEVIAATAIVAFTRPRLSGPTEPRASKRLRATAVGASILIALAAVSAILSAVGAERGLAPIRTSQEAGSAGPRTVHWQMLSEAVSRRPWIGWGWQQTATAQLAVASDFPPVHRPIAHAHNLLLDLMIWNGVPIGLLLGGLAVFWFWTRIRDCRDPSSAWLLAALGGFVVHAMLELPHEYAYFLIPAGLAIGAVETRSSTSAKRGSPIPVSRVVIVGASLVLGCVLLPIGVEALRAEEGQRALQFQAARVGRNPLEGLERLTWLDQQQAVLDVSQVLPRAGMPAVELALIERAAWRFPSPSLLYRLAQAQALNGSTEEAGRTLERLCRIHAPDWCLRLVISWQKQAAADGTRSMGRVKLPDVER